MIAETSAAITLIAAVIGATFIAITETLRTTAGSCAAIYGMATTGQPRAKGKSCEKDIAILDVIAAMCGATARTSVAINVTCTGTGGEKIGSSVHRVNGSSEEQRQSLLAANLRE